MPPLADVSAVDALAALSADGSRLTVSLVHRSAVSGPLQVVIDAGMSTQARAEVVLLSGETWWDANTEGEPERIIPRHSEIAVENGRATLTLPPYTYAQVVFRV
jgi:alpha-L-arabinofuranosidase